MTCFFLILVKIRDYLHFANIIVWYDYVVIIEYQFHKVTTTMWRLEGNKDMYPSLSKKVQIIACQMHCVSEFQKILQSLLVFGIRHHRYCTCLNDNDANEPVHIE